MKRWLRRYLGIDEIIATQRDMIKVNNNFRVQLRVALEGIGIAVAKLDPLRGTHEDDPSRVEASKKLGWETIQRLKAEDAVREKYGYTPDGEG